MKRPVLFLLVSAICFLVAGLDAAKLGVDILTAEAFALFGVSAFVAAKIP